jgi:nucleoid-associated protein YgaU
VTKPTYQKANNYEQATIEIEGGAKISCWFNPKEYSITKTNEYKGDRVVGAALPKVQFTGGHAREMSLDLLFDASDSATLDVVGVTNQLFEMMEPDKKLAGGGKNKARPPWVTFSWGKVISFKAAVKSLAVQFVLFRADGTPIRATAKLSLTQVEQLVTMKGGAGTARQNPTTTGVAGLGSHVIRQGDSLQSIAFSAYGDPNRWRGIAEANGIDDPLRLARGQILSLPPEAAE